jgi:hypothetical protein
LGISGQAGPWDNNGEFLWSAAVADAALHVSPYFELKGEYIYSWQQTSDLETISPHGWWIQAGYKLSGLNLGVPFLNKVELVARYDTLKNGLGIKTDRYTLGYVYYFSNTLLFQGDYEFINSNDPAANHNLFLFQLACGF